MYPLGEQFVPDLTKINSPKSNIKQGEKYRFTILSARVIRLEYNESGKFVNAPSEFAKSRDLGEAEFTLQEDQNNLMIKTKYFTLNYVKEAPFFGGKATPDKNLKIMLNDRHDKDRERNWYYGHPEIRNLGGNGIGIDTPVQEQFSHGLYSFEGFASIDDSHTKLIEQDGTLKDREPGGIDVYVFLYNNDFRHALIDYYGITGYPELIPRYALGNWWSRNTTYDDMGIDNLIKQFEKREIPLSIFIFDNDWHYRNVGENMGLKTGFSFNKQLLPSPEFTMKRIHDKDIKVGLKIDPAGGFYPHENYFQHVKKYLGVAEDKIIVFDPLNPKLLDVYFKVFLHPLEKMGVDFFWNNYSTTDLNKLWIMSHYQYLDATRDKTKRAIVLTRGGIYAPHRYPILYGGSSEITWDALKKTVFSTLNASNIGVTWWSYDVGGNHGGIEDPELYIRHVQFATFSPILRFNSARGPYYKKEPWLWEVTVEKIATDYLKLRHRLIPYLYTEAYNYSSVGVPIIQPFYYNYPWVYDDLLYKYQYYFGSQLLVCPILENEDLVMKRTVHRFFIPDGTWYDFVTGKKFPGGKKYVSFFRKEDYPVFAHAGSIIPLSNKLEGNKTGIPEDLEIQIFPGQSNMYTLYEDDGETYAYKEGNYLKTSIDYNYLKNNYTVIIRSVEGKAGIAPQKRNYKFVFRNTRKTDSIFVMFNDQKVQFSSYLDGNDFVLEIADVPTIGQLTINCRGKDIEIDAIRVINDDVNGILMDLQINTYLKEEVARIIYGDEPLQKKRVAIRKLQKSAKNLNGLDKQYVKLFLRLLDYMAEV